MPQIAIARAAAAVVVEGRAVVIAIPPVREGATMDVKEGALVVAAADAEAVVQVIVLQVVDGVAQVN